VVVSATTGTIHSSRRGVAPQRWLSTFSADGRTIDGRWETSPDGEEWELDLELSYRRLEL
jgi:hypothetical protein